ncbi:MAG: YdeI/OmpD-associated family protein [Niabella sp.]
MQSGEQWAEELALVAGILSKMPLEKTIKWGAEVFTYKGKNVVSYGGFKNYFTIWFYNGVFLKDKYKVLVNAQEGKTKSLRQWRFTSKDEIDEKKILEYLQEAIEVEKKGLKMQPEKFTPVEPPPLLSDALQEDKKLKIAFEKLTPGKQKEYILYIKEAKQEATQLSRLDKIKVMILQGVGLNDKYK